MPFLADRSKDVDARHKAGHDEDRYSALFYRLLLSQTLRWPSSSTLGHWCLGRHTNRISLQYDRHRPKLDPTHGPSTHRKSASSSPRSCVPCQSPVALRRHHRLGDETIALLRTVRCSLGNRAQNQNRSLRIPKPAELLLLHRLCRHLRRHGRLLCSRLGVCRGITVTVHLTLSFHAVKARGN